MIHVFICTDLFEDGLANSLCLNMLDQFGEVLEAVRYVYGIDQVTVGSDMNRLVAKSKSSSSRWGMFFRIGNHVTFSFMRNMWNNLNTADRDTAVIGHVLDRGDRYYELHEQAFILNLEKFRITTDIGYQPTPGSKPVIQRSTENYHDDYTPTWVKPGQGHLEVLNPAPGADLVVFGITHGGCRPFDEKERRGRYYMYPEWNFVNNLHKVEQDISNTQTKFFLFNTGGKHIPRDASGCTNVSRIVMPASGFLPFEMARELPLTHDFEFVFFDTSVAAQYLYRYMLDEWDGRDPRAIIAKSITGPHSVVIDGDMDVLWPGMMDRFGGHSEWLSFFRAYRSKYHLLSLDIMTGYDQPKFTQHFQKRPDDVVYGISNCFWYEPTSFLRSHSERVHMLARHLAYLRTTSPNLWIYYSMPGIEYNGRARDTQIPVDLNFPWRDHVQPLDNIIDMY